MSSNKIQRNKLIKERLALTLKVVENVKDLTYAGDEILRMVTETVELSEGLEIAQQLEEVLLQYREITGLGRGIAAPQIGLSKSVFVTYIDDVFEVFINPNIVNKSVTTNFYKELCMSSTVMSADVERSEWVIMEWIDKNGKKQSKKFDGFLARLLQHECAHLQGIINLDEDGCSSVEFVTSDPLKEVLRDGN